MDEKLRQKMESEQHKYDFKVIKRKLDDDLQDSRIYKS